MIPGLPPALIRGLCLGVPLVLLGAVWLWRRGHARRTTGALLAAGWNLPALLLLCALAPSLGWWRFDVRGGALAGVPLDLLIGWSLLWGPVAALAFRRTHPLLVLAALGAADMLLMPLCAPVVVLGPNWLVGELAALCLAALPGLLLSGWVRDGRRLGARVTLGVLAFGAWVLGVFPALAFEHASGDWSGLSLTGWRGALLQVVAVLAVPGLSAAQELVLRGGGTPLPYDPPPRLVTSGAYAYVANPMQVSCVLVLLAWGALLGSWWVAAAALVGVAYSAGLAAWHEDAQLRRRHGAAWRDYRRRVRRWLPRWRPGGPMGDRRATLYVAAGCDPCESVGAWFLTRGPVGLEGVPAQLHPRRDLTRITYDPGDGTPEEEGLAAIARALEHLNLAWAWLGWTIRLPPILWLGQLLVDAVGGGARPVNRCALPPVGGKSDSYAKGGGPHDAEIARVDRGDVGGDLERRGGPGGGAAG